MEWAVSSPVPTATSRHRAAVLLVQEGQVALIRRVRGGHTYFLFPGGGVEPGESPQEAAEREMLEETGLRVRTMACAAVVHFRGDTQSFFTCELLGGTWGAGTGEEYAGNLLAEYGTYEPVWLPLADLPRHDVRPAAVTRLAAESRERGWPQEPLRVDEG